MHKEDGFLSLYMTYICLHFQIRQRQQEVKTAEKKQFRRRRSSSGRRRRRSRWGRGGGCARLLESLPSLVAATGPASGSAIHSYQFASCCIFFSLVFHSLTHAILLFKPLKKDRGHFSQRSTAGALRKWEGRGKKKIHSAQAEIACTSGQLATQLRGKEKVRWKSLGIRG